MFYLHVREKRRTYSNFNSIVESQEVSKKLKFIENYIKRLKEPNRMGRASSVGSKHNITRNNIDHQNSAILDESRMSSPWPNQPILSGSAI